VGHEQDRDTARAPELAQLPVEPLARDLVERGERLVEQEQPRIRDQGPRQRPAHAHAARELGRIAPGRVGQPHLRQHGQGPLPALAR
jgi:hypothetical protein